jgi:hypothetical protein
MLSYLTNYLFPFVKFGGINPNSAIIPVLTALEKSYNTMINTSFNGNTMNLLNNITLDCPQIIEYCLFGFNTFYSGEDCCNQFFRCCFIMVESATAVS